MAGASFLESMPTALAFPAVVVAVTFVVSGYVAWVLERSRSLVEEQRASLIEVGRQYAQLVASVRAIVWRAEPDTAHDLKGSAATLGAVSLALPSFRDGRSAAPRRDPLRARRERRFPEILSDWSAPAGA